MTEPTPALTLRASETEVLMLLAHGWSVKQIARSLSLSKTAVVMRMSRCRDRLGARSTAHLVAVCVRAGLIHPGPLDGTAGRS